MSDHDFFEPPTGPPAASATSAEAPAASGGRRKGVAAGLAIGLLGGTAAGLVFGTPGLTNANASDAAPALVEQTDTTEPDATEPATTEPAGDRLRESLQELVDEGTLTAEQADAVVDHLLDQMSERGDRTGGMPGRGPDGGRGDRAGGFLFGRGSGVVSEALTDLLGLEADELRDQLRDGATLAEVAESAGVDVQAVIDELVGEYSERLDAAVENGRLDQSEADQRLARATERITELVNEGFPVRVTD